jgi:hypothetical protein
MPSRLLTPLASLAFLLALVAGHDARATVILGESSAFGLSVDLEVPILPDPFVPPTPYVAGAAPAPYDLSDAFLAFDGGFFELALLEAAAASDVDGGLGIRFAESSAGLKRLSLGFGPAFSLELLAFGAEARSEGELGALVSTGSSVLGSLLVEIGGAVVFDETIAPAPNTDFLPGLLDPLGIDLVLNEQILTGDGIHETGIVVNALHLSVDRPFVTGGVIFAHAESSLKAVPEPRVLVLLLLALAPAAWRARRPSEACAGRFASVQAT